MTTNNQQDDKMRAAFDSVRHAVKYAEYLDNYYCGSPIQTEHLKIILALASREQPDLISVISTLAEALQIAKSKIEMLNIKIPSYEHPENASFIDKALKLAAPYLGEES